MSDPMKYCIALAVDGGRMTRAEAASVMGVIMDGGATDAQIGGFLAVLRSRGEDPGELLGFLDAFRERATRIRLEDPDAVDLCGTGGDRSGTFNVSTVAAFVVAGAGVTVAKHGNRSVSSRSGSADVLRELGARIDIPPERMEACINTLRIGFLFAPLYHPAMKSAAKARAELGIRTCFNLLGPLANPAGVRRQVVGTFSAGAAETLGALFMEMQPAAALVLHSDDGLDEVSPSAPTQVREIRGGRGSRYTVDPGTFGLRRNGGTGGVAGGSPAQNAEIALSLLRGESRGAGRDFVLLNAAMGMMAARDGLSHEEAFGLCAESLDSGRASGCLRRFVEFTNL
jgi:anthranilate phosphoribosyltransferase